jgi:hypothetical protein
MELKGTIMSTNTNPLPQDADELVALAQAIATALEEKRNDLGIRTDSEGLLRVSIAAARYAMDRYLAVLFTLTKSTVAVDCLHEARTKCNRTMTHLRRQAARCIFRVCRHLDAVPTENWGSPTGVPQCKRCAPSHLRPAGAGNPHLRF